MTTRKPLENKRNPKTLWYFIPAVAWGVFITLGTLLPGDSVPRTLKDLNDKFIHAGIYFISTSLIYLGFIRYNFRYPLARNILGWIVALCITYGGVIELLQFFFIPNRSGSVSDFFANSAGVVLSAFIVHLVHINKA